MNVQYQLKNSLKVLIVDDQTGMTEFLERALIRVGHSPTVINNSLDALFEFKHNPENFDVIITDQIMSQMTGLELAQEILKINAQFPILFYVGINDQLRTKSDLPEGNTHLIKRPARFEEIIDFLNTIEIKQTCINNAEDVFCLVYVSEAKSNFSEIDLIDVLKTSRQNNEKLGITGVLILHNHCFLQMLEGDFKQINKLFYEKLCKDKRHQNLITIFQEFKSKRDFPNWNMGFYGDMKNDNLSLLSGFIDLNDHPAAHFFHEKFITAQKLLQNFQF